MFYWVVKTFVLGPVVNLLFRPWVKGLDNIPAEGGVILASNHLSFSDSIFLPLAVPRPVSFLAKSEYFTGKGLKGRLTALFFRLSNQLPMDRSGGAASATSLSGGAEVLAGGGMLGIYPEGTRSPDGRLYRGKVGVAKLALQTGVPVVPVAMIGTDKVQPIGRKVPNIRRIGIIVGEPLDFSRYKGLEEDRFIQRSVTDEIMYSLMRLSGQEYVDVYASSVKDKMAAARKAKSPTPAVRAPDPAEQPPRAVPPGSITIIGSKDAEEDAAPGKAPGKALGKEPGKAVRKEPGKDPGKDAGKTETGNGGMDDGGGPDADGTGWADGPG